jgi:hypothetical protein
MKITLSLIVAFLVIALVALVRNTSPAGVFHEASSGRDAALQDAVNLIP